MKEYKRIFADINLDHIEHNLEALHGLLPEKVPMLAVIKADGYGHGAVGLASFLEQKEYIYGYAVATADEAAELRKNGIHKPILILGYTFAEDYETLAKYDIMPAVYREDSLEALSQAAQRAGKTIKVHIKVDTGMGRIGISPDASGAAFVGKVLKTKGLQLEGIFTHFARADEADKRYAKNQLEIFQSFIRKIQKQYAVDIPIRHCANSAAVMELPESHLDLVRIGIAMYGLSPSSEIQKERLDLKPVMSLYSHIVYVKEVRKGTQIGYGGTFTAPKDMRIATISAGYADGYPRTVSPKGYVLIAGQKAPILGRICMDQFMADITEIPQATEDTLVTLIGKDQSEEITIEDVSMWSGRFHYELICDIGKRVPRKYLYEGEVIRVKDFYM